ncbi:MAG: ABC transporter substrate-binding protein [Oscillospiraceae bacterium]|nr:ABC transporter substrate-binding protein [Oscillospiraceae bacterium]
MKKIISLVLCLLMLCSVLCVSAFAEEDRIPIVIWDYFETDAQREMMTMLLDGFNEFQDTYVATHEYVPFANYKTQLQLGMTTGEMADLLIMDNPDMPAFAASGLLADISDYLEDFDDIDLYFPGPMNSTTLDGAHFGLPFCSNCLCLFYNKDMFEAAGIDFVPSNWEELEKACEMLAACDAVSATPLGFAGVATEEGTFQFMPWLYMAGATYETVGSEDGVEAMTFIKKLIDEGYLSKEITSWAQTDVNNQFMSGAIAMQFNGPWQLPGIAANAPDLNYGVALLPAGDSGTASGLGGENLAVVNGDNVAGAVEFLYYYNQPEVMIAAQKIYGAFPSRSDAAADEYWTADPVQATFIEQLNTAVARGPHPSWPSISEALYTMLQEVVIGTKTPADACAATQAKIDAILAQ